MKKVWFTTTFLALCTLIFCSCSKLTDNISTSNISGDDEYSKNSVVQESSLSDESSEQILPNENNKSSQASSEQTQSQNPLRSPFNTPDEAFLYKDGQKHIISNSQDIAKIIAILGDWFPEEGISYYSASLAVQEEMIDEIKSAEVAVELLYKNGRTATDTGEFSTCIRLLIPVKGQYKNNIFPCREEKYVNPYISGKDYKTDTRMSTVVDALFVQ